MIHLEKIVEKSIFYRKRDFEAEFDKVPRLTSGWFQDMLLRGYPRLHNSAFRAIGTFRNRLWGRFDAMSWSGENQPTGEKVGFLAKKTEKWAVLPTFYSVTTRSIFVILVSIDA